MREPTIFEKILEGEIPSTKIRENYEFVAILDVFPNCKWQALVIPKKWYESDISLMSDDVYSRYMLAVKEVVWVLKKGLWVKLVGIVVEGEWVPHAHVKLYPMHGLADMHPVEYEKVRFEQYPGYITSMLWNMKSKDELESIALEIATKNWSSTS